LILNEHVNFNLKPESIKINIEKPKINGEKPFLFLFFQFVYVAKSTQQTLPLSSFFSISSNLPLKSSSYCS